MLLKENYRSVNHRYDEGPTAEIQDPYVFSRLLVRIDPVAVLRAISVLEYQSCEHPGWEGSEAQAFCRALQGRAISHLPGYDEADWERLAASA